VFNSVQQGFNSVQQGRANQGRANQLDPAKLHLNLRLLFNAALATSKVAVSKTFDIFCRDCP